MTKRRRHDEGSIDPRGPDTWRLHHRADAPGRRKKKVGRCTLERYEELLKHHVVPTLGTRLLQKITVTKEFQDRTEKLGFGRVRLHDLRRTHETLLLDAGVPVRGVAERCGHDPAVLLRNDAKRTRGADDRAAAVIGELSEGSRRG